MATGDSIKSRYRGRLTAFVACFALLVFVVFSGSDVLGAIEARQWTALVGLKPMLSLALPLTTLILDGIVTSDFKAVLVYWKWRNPLPGHEAFTVHGREDSRVDMNAVEAEHGPLPTDPAEQNLLWYQLSKATADRASVDEAHYAWLLTRDLTNLSLGLLMGERRTRSCASHRWMGVDRLGQRSRVALRRAEPGSSEQGHPLRHDGAGRSGNLSVTEAAEALLVPSGCLPREAGSTAASDRPLDLVLVVSTLIALLADDVLS